jgi:oxygen-independent coproporphyrinogen III oxidase
MCLTMFRNSSCFEDAGLAIIDATRIRLTEAGLERADVIGPWLYSAEVVARMEDFAWR